MLKIVLGVIAGFVAWSVLWVGTDAVISMASPSWYGAHQNSFAMAMGTGQPFAADTTILGMHLIRAVIITLMSAFLAAFIAGENRRAPLFLGILLLLFGIMVQAMAWNYLPLWYHLIFLGLLIPVSIIGGKIKQTS